MKINLKQQMKTKLMVSMIVLAATMVVLSGCSDDDDKKPTRSFTVDGSETAIKTAFSLYDPEPYNDIYTHDLYLLSEGFTVNGHSIDGKGNSLYFQIEGPTTDLDEGTYQVVEFNADEEPFQIDWAAVLFNVTMKESGGTGDGEILIISSGEMVISKSGNNYSIKFTGVADGKAVTVSYTGPITIEAED